jgi:hypothetical protein
MFGHEPVAASVTGSPISSPAVMPPAAALAWTMVA